MIAWFRRQRFGALFVALIAVMFAYPIFHEFAGTRLIFDITRAIFFVIALWVVFEDRRLRVLAFAIGTPSLIAVMVRMVLGDSRPTSVEVFFHGLSAIFFGMTVYAILRRVYRVPDVTASSVYGAFCCYLLIGIIFGHLYCILELIRPESFIITNPNLAVTESLGRDDYALIYYSLITITTVGYGDIVPANSASRSLSTIEAILGQFMIVVLVAELIGKRVSQAVSTPHSEDPET
jgi:voltage-gated potassium channel